MVQMQSSVAKVGAWDCPLSNLQPDRTNNKKVLSITSKEPGICSLMTGSGRCGTGTEVERLIEAGASVNERDIAWV